MAVAAALLGLIVLLATLQYRWLGRISAAERERMTTTLTARGNALALDFDRELTLAYMLFHAEPGLPGVAADQSLPTRLTSPLRALAGDRAVSEVDPRASTSRPRR